VFYLVKDAYHHFLRYAMVSNCLVIAEDEIGEELQQQFSTQEHVLCVFFDRNDSFGILCPSKLQYLFRSNYYTQIDLEIC
jgi:hypothetical protein